MESKCLVEMSKRQQQQQAKQQWAHSFQGWSWHLVHSLTNVPLSSPGMQWCPLWPIFERKRLNTFMRCSILYAEPSLCKSVIIWCVRVCPCMLTDPSVHCAGRASLAFPKHLCFAHRQFVEGLLRPNLFRTGLKISIAQAWAHHYSLGSSSGGIR